MVLMYHIIGPGEELSEWTRSPDSFRRDLELLQAEGYWPINLRDLVRAHASWVDRRGGFADEAVDAGPRTGGTSPVELLSAPGGTAPVVLTFDDSTQGQYRVLPDGRLDPDCAVGIMQAAVARGAWAPQATFFPLLEMPTPERVVFGQPQWGERKLRSLVDWGYEVGSHTLSHLKLDDASPADAVRELALSKAVLERMIGGGFEVETLALPYGLYPDSDTLFAGAFEGIEYRYRGVVQVGGGPCPSPFSTGFDPLHIPRIQVTGLALDEQIAFFRKHPELHFRQRPTATSGGQVRHDAPSTLVG